MDRAPWTVLGLVDHAGTSTEMNGDMIYAGVRVEGQEVPLFQVDEAMAAPFSQAVREGVARNLHFCALGATSQLVGFEGANGLVSDTRTFWLGRLLMWSIFVFGVLTVPFFGTGLVILFAWFGLFKRSRPAARLAAHARDLRRLHAAAPQA